MQACGDAHLLNFGGFATPERNVVFDINDLDETLPAPWEWDLKRLTAEHGDRRARLADDRNRLRPRGLATVRSYRQHMADYSAMRALEVWYETISVEDVMAVQDEKTRERMKQRLEKAEERSTPELSSPSWWSIAATRRGQGRTALDLSRVGRS